MLCLSFILYSMDLAFLREKNLSNFIAIVVSAAEQPLYLITM